MTKNKSIYDKMNKKQVLDMIDNIIEGIDDDIDNDFKRKKKWEMERRVFIGD